MAERFASVEGVQKQLREVDYLADTNISGVTFLADRLGKPVLVMRNTTERPEGVDAGTALLVGTAAERIFGEAKRLLDDRRHTLVESPFDDPRVAETELRAKVTWVNRRRQLLVPAQSIALSPELVSLNQTSTLIPEVGQTVATSQQQAIQRLAEQIVSTMEAPW